MKDWAAVAIHSVAPLLLLLLAEAAPAYRRAFAEALKTITPEPEAERIADVSETAPEALPQRVRVALPPRLLARATTVNAAALEKTGKPASIRSLMAELRVGADRAKDVKRALSAVPATS
jgi:hypothetical protein